MVSSRPIDRVALGEYLALQAQLPQRLGVVDCTTFVVEALLVGWGIDYREALEYSDRRSAVRQLRREGGLHGAFFKRLGPTVPASLLEEGDIVYFPKPATVGLVLDAMDGKYAAVKGHKQIIRAELVHGLNGWRVPRWAQDSYQVQ